jgi:hypothetical protein
MFSDDTPYYYALINRNDLAQDVLQLIYKKENIQNILSDLIA